MKRAGSSRGALPEAGGVRLRLPALLRTLSALCLPALLAFAGAAP